MNDYEFDRMFPRPSADAPLGTGARDDLLLAVRVAGSAIVQRVVAGRERSLALTKLQEALMWSIAGLAAERSGVGSEISPAA